MSSQQSAIPIHTKKNDRKGTLNLDPYAAPDVYYGNSHSPRQVAKNRTYSAIEPQRHSGLDHGNRSARRTSQGMSARDVLAETHADSLHQTPRVISHAAT